ncbi:FabD/lysophospholipase-like protein [Penicillium sp. IBT 35674x]|nr:FabD/lysophospholipase-like protein [Penicillium sp. IBT 35674x]
MSKCDHSAWLQLLQGEAGPLLSHGWRLPHIIKDFPNPSEQCPQITLLLGRRLKEKALRKLCDSNYKGQRRKNAINIRADNRSLGALQPRLFADCDPTATSLERADIPSQNCHQDHVLSFRTIPYLVHDLLLSRLLFMFVDVICIFADDLGGLDAVESMLLDWGHISSGSSLPSTVRPRVVVVVNKAQSVTRDVLDEKDFLFDLYMRQPSLNEAFADIQFSYLPSSELASGRFLSLSADITRQLHDARFARLQTHALFSATHLSELFRSATENLCSSALTQFDFIAAARAQNPLDGSFTSHLREFLILAGKSRLPYEGVSSHIASAILMDAYPPGMHFRLKPATSASRVLSIDGGGPRGIIPLENLQILQNILGPELPLSDMIDLTVGCSSGGLIALSKFMLRMEIQSCKALFQDLARKVLAPTRKRRFLRSWLSDGLYDVKDLEGALQDHYTPMRRMFDTPQDNISSNKVAVIASEIKVGAPFIFANYNGAAPHRAEPAYGRLRPDSEKEPFTWQV